MTKLDAIGLALVLLLFCLVLTGLWLATGDVVFVAAAGAGGVLMTAGVWGIDE